MICETNNWICPFLDSTITDSGIHGFCAIGVFDAGDTPPTDCPNVLAIKTVQEQNGEVLVAVTEATYRAIMRQRGIGAARGEE